MNGNYILTASAADTGKMLSKISLPYRGAVELVTGMVRVLLGE